LALPGTAEFSYQIAMTSGKLQSDFPIDMLYKRKLEGQIGTQSNNVSLQTSSGGIEILKSE
jgi:hypothetical protein